MYNKLNSNSKEEMEVDREEVSDIYSIGRVVRSNGKNYA